MSIGLRLVPKGKKTPTRGALRRMIDEEILRAVHMAKAPFIARIAKLEALHRAVSAYDSWLSGEGDVSLEIQRKLWLAVIEAKKGCGS